MKKAIIITAVSTFLLTVLFFGMFNVLNPRYIVVPEGNKGTTFNTDYGIIFSGKNVKPSSIKKFNDVKNILKNDYYKDIDDAVLLEGAIGGMADSLNDPYTVYFTSEQMKDFSEKTEGSYVGIGISITMDTDGLLTVIQAFEGSPAKAAGIIKGDKIIKVNDKDVTAIRDEAMIISMIKGKENTPVKITVYRQKEVKSIDFNIMRKKIKIENISSEVLDNNIGYIRISQFDAEIATYFNNHLNKLLKNDIKGLVIDVRDNPGGDYNQVVAIADRLLPEGVIVYTEDRLGNKIYEKSDATELSIPIAVLVNGNSASASEVLAGALKDYGKGVLVGTKTFGKGLVQEVKTLSDGSGIKLTVARYFTPSGKCIQDIGIEPNKEVFSNEKYKEFVASEIPREDDIQLKTAISLLGNIH